MEKIDFIEHIGMYQCASHRFSCLCCPTYLHDKLWALHVRTIFLELERHLNQSQVLHLMSCDWWFKDDLLVISKEQAAGGKLFCPCPLRDLLLCFFFMFALFSNTTVAFSCSDLLHPAVPFHIWLWSWAVANSGTSQTDALIQLWWRSREI